jgi:hypothetical protein
MYLGTIVFTGNAFMGHAIRTLFVLLFSSGYAKPTLNFLSESAKVRRRTCLIAERLIWRLGAYRELAETHAGVV